MQLAEFKLQVALGLMVAESATKDMEARRIELWRENQPKLLDREAHAMQSQWFLGRASDYTPMAPGSDSWDDYYQAPPDGHPHHCSQNRKTSDDY